MGNIVSLFFSKTADHKTDRQSNDKQESLRRQTLTAYRNANRYSKTLLAIKHEIDAALSKMDDYETVAHARARLVRKDNDKENSTSRVTTTTTTSKDRPLSTLYLPNKYHIDHQTYHQHLEWILTELERNQEWMRQLEGALVDTAAP